MHLPLFKNTHYKSSHSDSVAQAPSLSLHLRRAMATIAAPSASIKQPSSAIPSHQYPSLPVARPFRFTTAQRHTLSYSASPKSPMAISEKAPAANSSSPKAPPKPIIVIDNYDSFTYNLCQVSLVSFLHCFFTDSLFLNKLSNVK